MAMVIQISATGPMRVRSAQHAKSERRAPNKYGLAHTRGIPAELHQLIHKPAAKRRSATVATKPGKTGVQHGMQQIDVEFRREIRWEAR